MNNPCETCVHNDTCGLKCNDFKKWFSQEWRRIRKMFGIEVEDNATD